MRLADLNALAKEDAAAELLRCCGSTRWARLMAERRPFPSVPQMADVADQIWRSLAPGDWLEAFAAHPRIGAAVPAAMPIMSGGSEAAGRPEGSHVQDWSSREQSGLAAVGADVRERLAQGNRDYEARFGYIFIVCATGKSANKMLDILWRRLPNAPAEELQIAAAEQAKITKLRLAKLVN